MKMIINVKILREFKNTFLAEWQDQEVLIIKNDHTEEFKNGEILSIEVTDITKRKGQVSSDNSQKRIFSPVSFIGITNAVDVNNDVETLNVLIKQIRQDMSENKHSRAFSEAIRLISSNRKLSDTFEPISLEYRAYLIRKDFNLISAHLNCAEEDQTAEALEIIEKLLEKKSRFRGLYPLLQELYQFSNEAQARKRIQDKNTYKADFRRSRLLSLADMPHEVGQIATFKGREVKISKIGKAFELTNSDRLVPEFLRKKWANKQVCWLYFDELEGKLSPEDQKIQEDKVKNYYAKNTSNPKKTVNDSHTVGKCETKKSNTEVRNHIWASKTFMHHVAYIKSKGIKPRHRQDLIEEIKNSVVICDNRNMIAEGGSWIAYNNQYIWYMTYQLSSLAFDNNIRINNQMAQCWRMLSIDAPENMIDELREIHAILFAI